MFLPISIAGAAAALDITVFCPLQLSSVFNELITVGSCWETEVQTVRPEMRRSWVN